MKTYRVTEYQANILKGLLRREIRRSHKGEGRLSEKYGDEAPMQKVRDRRKAMYEAFETLGGNPDDIEEGA